MDSINIKRITYLTAVFFIIALSVFAQSGEPAVKWEIGKSKNIVYKWSGHEIGDILNISLSWANLEVATPEEVGKGITLKEFALTSPSGSEKEKFDLPASTTPGIYKIKIETRNATGTIASVLSKKTYEVIEKEAKKEPKPGETKIDQLNEEVLDLIKEVYDKPILGVFGDYKLKSDPKTAAKEEKLKEVLKERKKELIDLIETNPKQALEEAVLANLREKLPENIKNEVESPLNTAGTLEIIHADNSTNPSKSTVDYYLSSNDSITQRPTFQSYLADLIDAFQGNNDNVTQASHTKLYFASGIPLALSGSKINVNGIKIDPAAVANHAIREQATTISTGNKKALVFFLTDPRHKDRRQPFEPKTFTNEFINPILESYFSEASYNQLSFQAHAFGGWLETQTSCNVAILYTQSVVECKILDSSLANAIRSAGDLVDIGNYTNLIFIYTVDGGCGYKGAGSLGNINVSIKSGSKDLGLVWLPFDISKSLEENKNRLAGTLIHEIGHNLGLPHANILFNCTDSNSYTYCSKDEYGDSYDVMGQSQNKGQYNGIYKKSLGWLTDQNILEVSKSGTYSLAPIELKSNTTQVLTIPRKKRTIGNQYWAIEYRKNSNGTIIRLVEGAKSVFINPSVFHLSTPLDITYLFQEQRPILLPGQIFKDPSEEISIEVLNVESQKLTVEITFEQQKEQPRKEQLRIKILDLPAYNTLGLNQTYKVTISPNFAISNDILISLVDTKGNKTLIKVDKPASRAYSFPTTISVPKNLDAGRYQILTESKHENQIVSYGQIIYIVKSELAVSKPAGGITLTEGAKQLIAWSKNLSEGISIDIKLLKQSPVGDWKLSKTSYNNETSHQVFQKVINQKTFDALDTCDKKASDYNSVVPPFDWTQVTLPASAYQCPATSSNRKTSCTDVSGLYPILNGAVNNFGYYIEGNSAGNVNGHNFYYYKEKGNYEVFGVYSDNGRKYLSGGFKISGSLGEEEFNKQFNDAVQKFLRNTDGNYNLAHLGYVYSKRDVTCEYNTPPTEFSKQTEVVSTIFSGVPEKDEFNWTIPKLSPEDKYLIEISCTGDPEGKWCEKGLSQPFRIVPLVFVR